MAAMTDPTPPIPSEPGLWQRPVVRGVVNGAIFTIMLCVIQAFGLFGPARALDSDSVAGNVMAGVIFGFALYILELWRRQRRSSAADVARRVVERRVEVRERGNGRR